MHDSTFDNGPSIPAGIVSQAEKTGRRSHKMMAVANPPKKVPIWPPLLEEALLEALTIYRPASKTGRPLRRFTKRNCFISRHIFAKTGKRRTPKQVGSRLQQISESSTNAELKKLITNRDFSNRSPVPEEMEEIPSPGSSRLSPTALNSSSDYTSSTISDMDSSEHILSPLFDHKLLNPLLDTPPVCSTDFSQEDFTEDTMSHDNLSVNSITLLVELVSSDTENGSTQLGLDADITDNGINFIMSFDSNENAGTYNSFYNARRLSNIPTQSLFYQVPQLTVVSPFLQPDCAYQFSYGVYLDGSTLIHTETAMVLPSEGIVDYPSGTSVWKSPVLPEYWTKFTSSLGRYTIMLDISEAPLSRGNFDHFKTKLSIAFHFKPTISPIDDLSVAQTFYNPTIVDELPMSVGSLPCMPPGNASSLTSNSGILPGSQYPWFDPLTSYYPILSDNCVMTTIHDTSVLPTDNLVVVPYTYSQF